MRRRWRPAFLLMLAFVVVMAPGLVVTQWTRICILKTDTSRPAAVSKAFAHCVERGDRDLAARFVAHGHADVLDQAPWWMDLDNEMPVWVEDYASQSRTWRRFLTADRRDSVTIVMEKRDDGRWWVTEVEVQ